MRDIERFLLLQIIDQRWREHLYDMDYLREGIHLRGFAQIEPLVAYKNEAFELFRDLMNSIWDDFARLIFHVEVTPVEGPNGGPPQAPPQRRPSSAASSPTGGGRVTYSGGGGAPQGAMAIAAAAGGGGARGSRRPARGADRPGPGRAAARRSRRADRAQRPVLVRVGQEVQEVPRCLTGRHGAWEETASIPKFLPERSRAAAQASPVAASPRLRPGRRCRPGRPATRTDRRRGRSPARRGTRR